MKKALLGLVGLFVLTAGAALVVPGFINWNDYKSEIADKAREATGRRLAIDGDIGFTILPTPALQVNLLRLANLPGAASPEMVTIQSLEVEVALIPLLSGELQIKRVRVNKPVISIEIMADGRANTEFRTANDTASEEAGSNANLSLDSLLIENASISYVDVKGGIFETIEDLSAELSAASLQGPFKVEGQLTDRGLTTTFKAGTGALNTGRAIPINLDLALTNGAGLLTFKGSLSEASAKGNLKGKLEVSAPDALTLAQALTPIIGAPVPELPALKQKLAIAGDMEASATVIALNSILAKIGETTAAGAISAELEGTPRIDLALDVNRVNLDTWLKAPPPVADAAANTNANANDLASSPGKPTAPFVIPKDLAGTAALTVSGITWKGSAIRQVQVSASLGHGSVNIEKIAAHLPGGANVDLVGTLQAVNNLPQFEGAVRASADNLRAFLGWVGADISSVPMDRLRSSSLSATVRATPKLAEIYGIDMRLDSSRLTGGAAYAFRTRPAFSVDFTVDQLNLDVYQKKKPPAEAQKSSGGLMAASSGTLPPDLAEALNAFDANIKLNLKKFTANGVSIKGALIDVGLQAGELTVRNISTDDLAGAKFIFQGTASNLDRKPVVDGQLDLQTANVQGLSRLLGLELPVPASRLGKFHAAGTILGSSEAIALDMTVLAAKTTTALKGNFAMDGAGPRLDMDIKASNKSYVKLWQVFDPAFRMARGGKDGPLSLTGKIAGDLSQIKIDLKTILGQAIVSANGKLRPLGSSYNLKLSARHADASEFLQGLGVNYSPAARNFGGLSLKADIKGDAKSAAITNLDGSFGPMTIKGTAATSFAGQRPFVEAELQTSEIFVDLFLPRNRNKPGGQATSAGANKVQGVERWSSDPIDLSGLHATDLEIKLNAPGIIYGTYQFVEPRVTVLLKDGVLRIEPLRGKLFDGDVTLTARISDGQVPAVDMTVAVSGGNLRKALMEAAQIDAATGTVRLEGKFTTRGHSQRDMISRLSGTASFASENGKVKGIDLKRLSANLKQLDRTRDFLSLANTSMSGGETGYTSLGGTFQLEDGVARSSDLKADLEAATGSGHASIDLPRWVMDMTTNFRLTDHPSAPSIGLNLHGPLDNPKRKIKSRDLERYVANRVGGTLVRKLLGKKAKGLGGLLQPSPTSAPQATPDAPPPQPTQQPLQQKIKPEDVVKGLLKGLFKQ